ncbi:hypothetical protein [Achromobacter spanius]|uniref:hypothetical protein n=1 Tax=Achromobacter spanius TaxID=217203 RepID=UPI003F694D3F
MTLPAEEIKRRATIVSRQHNGVLPFHREFYARSIYFAASRAIQSYNRFVEAVEQVEHGEAVSSLHEALGHTAALSRFFWPSELGGKRNPELKELAKARAAYLRVLYQLDDQSPLKNRDLRDALEHFDERLDAYLLGLEAGFVFPDPMLGPVDLGQQPPGHIFKLVDPFRQVFVLFGRRFDYAPMLPELERIAEVANGCYES